MSLTDGGPWRLFRMYRGYKYEGVVAVDKSTVGAWSLGEARRDKARRRRKGRDGRGVPTVPISVSPHALAAEEDEIGDFVTAGLEDGLLDVITVAAADADLGYARIVAVEPSVGVVRG